MLPSGSDVDPDWFSKQYDRLWIELYVASTIFMMSLPLCLPSLLVDFLDGPVIQDNTLAMALAGLLVSFPPAMRHWLEGYLRRLFRELERK